MFVCMCLYVSYVCVHMCDIVYYIISMCNIYVYLICAVFSLFVFVSYLRGDPLSQRLLFWGPMKSLQVHTHTVTHNTIISNPEQSSFIVYTHTLCGQW